MRLRVQIAVAVAMAAGAVVAALLVFGERRQWWSGTNSTGSSASAGRVRPGQELCVRDLWLPAGSDAILLYLGRAGGPAGDVALRLRTSSATLRSHARITGQGPGEVVFPLPVLRRGARAQACLTGEIGEVSGTNALPFAGLNYQPLGYQVGMLPNATLEGRPLGVLVSVNFRSARRRARLSLLTAGAKRAAVFRPAGVRPWTYGVLAVLVAGTWVAGLTALWTSKR